MELITKIVSIVFICAIIGYIAYFSVHKNSPLFTYRGTRWKYRFACLLIACLCFGVAVRKPTFGERQSDQDGVGFDVMVMLDVSKSMLVEDVDYKGSQTSRLTAAKTLISELVQEAPEHRRGLGVFAGEAIGISPLTSDPNTFLTFLGGVDYQNVTEQGTDIVGAVRVGADRFDKETESGRVLLVVSDGGEQDVSFDTTLLDNLEELGVYVVGIGVGSKTGGPIPLQKDSYGNVTYRQFQGQTVISSYEEKVMKELVRETDGVHIRLDDTDGVDIILDRFGSIEKTAIERSPTVSDRVWIREFVGLGGVFFLLFLLLHDLTVQRKASELLHTLARLYTHE